MSITNFLNSENKFTVKVISYENQMLTNELLE